MGSPGPSGVPEIVPLLDRVSPAGKLLNVRAKLYGAVPPLAVMV